MAQEISVSILKCAYDAKRSDYVNFQTKHGLFQNIPRFIDKTAWSPITWRHGYRSSANFIGTSLVGLDFDSPDWTLAYAIDFFSSLNVPLIIGTTKSHQLQKDKKPPCDRYRVIFAAEHTASLKDYRYTMQRLTQDFPADKSCIDGGRWFHPCKEVVHVKLEGQPLGWKVAPPPKPRQVVDYDPGEMPWWVRDWLNNGATERHLTCYKIGAELCRLGYSFDEIITKIMRGPLSAIGEADVVRAVENGMGRAVADLEGVEA